MSSEDFFKQSFSPNKSAGTTTSRRPSAPPPPPPPGASSSSTMRSRPAASSVYGNSSSTLASASASAPISASSSKPATTSSSQSSSGYYGSRNSSSNNMRARAGANARSTTSARPTGNYYATTSTSATSLSSSGSAAPKPSFHAYSGYGSGSGSGSGNNLSMATNPVPLSSVPTSNNTMNNNLQSSGSGASMNSGEDWFTGSSVPTSTSAAPAPSATSMNGINMMNMTNSNTATSTTTAYNTAAVAAAPSPYNMMSQQPQQPQQPQQQPHFQPTQPQPQGQNAFSGAMDTNMSGPMMMQQHPTTNTATTTTTSGPNTSMKGSSSSSSFRYTYNPDDFADEPPLLEELGVNISHIRTKSLAVILPVRYAKTAIDKNLMDDTDMAGPIAFGILLALELLLAGRIQFAYVYGLGVFGCFATTLIINLMSPSDSISIWTVVSILGYSLLPVNLLAGVNIFYRIRLMGDIGVILAALTIVWCTISSARLFERGCGLRDQRYLIGYPNALLYSAFVLLTIF